MWSMVNSLKGENSLSCICCFGMLRAFHVYKLHIFIHMWILILWISILSCIIWQRCSMFFRTFLIYFIFVKIFWGNMQQQNVKLEPCHPRSKWCVTNCTSSSLIAYHPFYLIQFCHQNKYARETILHGWYASFRIPKVNNGYDHVNFVENAWLCGL